MPKQLSDLHISVARVDTAPADPNAVTAAEFDAGVRLECRIMDFRLSPTASDTISQSELCTATNAQVPTRSNYEGSVTVFRYLDEDGLADAANDVAWEAFKEKGTVHHLIVREGPSHEDDGAAGQEYSYYEVIQDNPQVPADRGGFIRREIPLYVQRAFLDKALVAG